MSAPTPNARDSLERLHIWAAGGDPDVPGAHHCYHAGCPFRNDTRHGTGQALLAIAEAAANLRSSADECDRYRDTGHQSSVDTSSQSSTSPMKLMVPTHNTTPLENAASRNAFDGETSGPGASAAMKSR